MNERLILPNGEILRDFLRQPSITRADIRKIVRQRGLFLRSDEKLYTIPALVKTGLTASEFETLIALISDKDEIPKFSSQSIPSLQSPSSLYDALDQHFKPDSSFDVAFKNYTVKGRPQFVTKDGNANEVEIKFSIIRTDLSKSFTQSKRPFFGKIRLSVDNLSNDINILSTYTSKETKVICSDITRECIKCLKLAEFIGNNVSIEKIQYSHFSNEGRLNFLNSLSTTKSSTFLTFEAINDIGFKPAVYAGSHALLDLLEENINNIRFRGQGLERLKLFSDKTVYPMIELFRIESDFTFNFNEGSGTCRVSFDFTDYHQDDDFHAELIISMPKITIFPSTSFGNSLNTNIALDRIRTILETEKNKLHKLFRNKSYGNG